VSYATLTITVGLKALGERSFLFNYEAFYEDFYEASLDRGSAIIEFLEEAIRVKLLL
jgi:hypothetical protein